MQKTKKPRRSPGKSNRVRRGKAKSLSAQQTIPYLVMHPDGVCQLPGGLYTRTVEYEDINYSVASTEDQTAIFGGWSAFLNYFDCSLPFQLSFVNRRSRSTSRYKVNIPNQEDDFNSIRGEFVDMLKGQIAKSNNGIERSKYITFGLPADGIADARPRLGRVESDVIGNLSRLGVPCNPLDGRERLAVLHGQMHPGSREPFRFSWKDIPKTGMGTKDYIAPDSFDFRQGRTFRVGQYWGAASYLQILASELSDKLLAEILELDAELTVTMHVQTVDQLKAIKTVKGKISDIGRMKVEEQKKAVRAGYDMDILPPDLITFSKDAAELLADLQSRNERMFLLTFTVVNLAPTKQRLENDVFTVSGIAQKYNCALKRLDWQQEQAFVSSLVLGYNAIEIQRGMTTSSTAIFIPFMTRELRMDGQALYYGMNALSHNVIMADRKKLKSANGLYLGSTGSGKSFAAKRELINVFLATNDRIVVVDPMGEYAPLVKRLGGQVIEIAPDSPNHINPMDIQLLTNDEDSPLSMKADFLLSLCELIVGGKEGLQPIEKTVIDRCVRLVYRELALGIGSGDMPLLQDLYEELLKQPEPEAKRVVTALELYCTGSLNLFNHRTNVQTDATEKAASGIVAFVKRHPVGAALFAVLLLVLVLLQSCMSSLVSMGNGALGAVSASTYQAEDADIRAAERAYCELEAELQEKLDNYESDHDYDEYHSDLDDIEHDPYVLISILSAWHEGAWTIDEVQGTLEMLFEKQYILTEEVVRQTRYRTETRTGTRLVYDEDLDEYVEEEYEYEVQVPYSYYICTVTLENFNLSHLPIYIMGEDMLSRYALYMATLGNRPDLFPTSSYVRKYTSDPVLHEVPEEYLADETFAAIYEEAQKYIGYPYVWGGYKPSTSFDCSGYVSWVYNQCGWDFGRLGAQGLYNISTRVTTPKPGDLVFFTGTYDTPGVSHVGIYVGDGWMLHCGDPIGYADLSASYWQSHFYAYGRLT